ncbi:MAG TPA: bacterioferritin [Dehalococcoidia bacterium]|nr:bacterioferritin [Dehalococcoidia bacterium]
MRAKQGIPELLNRVLTIQLTAINQYFVHAKMCENWGFERLEEKLRDDSIDLMRDAEKLVEHILYLEGLPNLQRLGTIHVGESVPEDLRLNLTAEQDAAAQLTDGVRHCLEVGDYTTHTILETFLEKTEERIDWLETQLTTIEQVGLQNYLARQVG